MKQGSRIAIAVLFLVVAGGVVLGIDALRRTAPQPAAGAAPTVPPGNIPIYVDGTLRASFGPGDLGPLAQASFVDPGESIEQKGWLLRDVVLLYVDRAQLQADTRIVVSSSTRGKKAEVTWAEADNPDNKLIFDLANRGTLKLVSVLPRLATRDQWVQDVDRVDISRP